MRSESIIKIFFHMTTTIKLYHWQTSSYPRHKATCDLLAAILPLIDTFVETYMGRYQRPVFESGFKMNIQELKDNDDSAPSLIKDYIFYLQNDLPKYVEDNDTDLLNIRDEIVSNLNKTLYLFTLQ
jgi:hypothetical protein